MENIERVYEYRPRWQAFLVPAGIGLMFVFVFGGLALFSNRGAVINGQMLTPTEAKNLYLFLCGVSFVSCAIVACGLYELSRSRRRLVLRHSTLVVPAAFWSVEMCEIGYHEITNVCYIPFGMTIHTSSFKTRILAAMLPSAVAFVEVRQLLVERIAAKRNSGMQNRKQWDFQFAFELLMFAWFVLAMAVLIVHSTLNCFREGKFAPGELVLAFVAVVMLLLVRYGVKGDGRQQAIDIERARQDIERAQQQQSERERVYQKLVDGNYAQAEKELSLRQSTQFSGPVIEVIANSGQYIGRLVQFKGGRMVIGRLPTCELFLENGAVGRQHAAITEVQGEYRIEDLQSRCGTCVNSVRIDGPTELKDGDFIGVADNVMQFHKSYLRESKLSLFRELLVEGFGKKIGLTDEQWQKFRELWEMRITLISTAHRRYEGLANLTLMLHELDQKVYDLLTDEQKNLWTQRHEELKTVQRSAGIEQAQQPERGQVQQALADDDYAHAEKELSLSKAEFSGRVLEVIAITSGYSGPLLHVGQSFPLKRGRTTIGRHPTCELFLDTIHIARKHAAIIETEGTSRIEDLQSNCGTDVNGTRCTEPTELKNGDIIRVAIVVMRFHESYSRDVNSGLFRELHVERFGKKIDLTDEQWQKFRELWEMRNTLILSTSVWRDLTSLTLMLQELDQRVFDLLTDEQQILWTQRQEELKTVQRSTEAG